jgi:hypothetical protein
MTDNIGTESLASNRDARFEVVVLVPMYSSLVVKVSRYKQTNMGQMQLSCFSVDGANVLRASTHDRVQGQL